MNVLEPEELAKAFAPIVEHIIAKLVVAIQDVEGNVFKQLSGKEITVTIKLPQFDA